MARAGSHWRRRSRPAFALTAALLVAGLPALPTLAQEATVQPVAPRAQGSESVGARLGRLEDKVRDLQVMVGTLESFIRAKPGAMLPQEAPAAPVPAPQSDLGPRIDALETQITALTSHIEQIGRQMSALQAKLSALQVPPPVPAAEPEPQRQGEAPPPAPDTATATASVPAGDSEAIGDTSKPRWYGPKPGTEEYSAPPDNQADSEPQNLTAALPGSGAQELYQQGYGALLRKDYAAAESAFRELVAAYPKDPLAANAQYWIGESYYARGRFKDAADAFLKGYQSHKAGEKAPDTLLKLGMSLAELGQKDAACSTFNELKTKYPGAPEPIGDEAKAWQKKAGC